MTPEPRASLETCHSLCLMIELLLFFKELQMTENYVLNILQEKTLFEWWSVDREILWVQRRATFSNMTF